MSEDLSRTLSWVVHTPLLPTSSYKECSGRTLQARRGWLHDSVGLSTYPDRSAQKTSLSLSKSFWET